jgi:membrane-bound lytic murein transglycosylase B
MPLSLSRLVVAIATAVALLVLAVPATVVAQDPTAPTRVVPFPDWLTQLRKDAITRGISEPTVDAALAGVEQLPVVVERDRTQAERTQTIAEYLRRRLDRRTVTTAREMMARHTALLSKISNQYGVPAGIIVAVWGLESNFGRFTGVRPTIAALATLAYDNRRAAMFREELFNALQILDRGDIDLGKMKGSWAGAMGQPQFMPSSYLKFAEDFDGDGKRDIWGSEADVFASVANYLKQNGWTTGNRWGRAVSIPASANEKIAAEAPLRTAGCEATRQMTEAIPLPRWSALGVRTAGQQALPTSSITASLVRAGTRSFLVYDNYAALLQYNCAHAYALAVGLLADSLPASTPPAK